MPRPSFGVRPGSGKAGYAYRYSAVDGFRQLAYTEALQDENASTAIAFTHRGPGIFLTAYGISQNQRLVIGQASTTKT